MKNKTKVKNLAIRVDTSPALGAEIRRLAADLPGVKVGTLTIAAIRAGLPIIKAKLVEKAATLADD